MTLIELRQLRNQKIAENTKWLVALITNNKTVDAVNARLQILINSYVIDDCERQLRELGVNW